MFILVAVLVQPFCTVQSQNYFKNYTLENGLPQSQVTAVFQDNGGYLWIGTIGGGVARFDGNQFKAFTTKDGLPSNTINWINQDPQGNLWIATSNGIAKKVGNVFTSFLSKDDLQTNDVWTMVWENKTVVWCATLGGGLIRFEGGKFRQYTTANGLPSDNVQDMFYANDELWLATDRGLCRFDSKQFENVSIKIGLGSDQVHSVMQDSKDRFWISTHDRGVIQYYGDQVKTFSKRQGLVYDDVRSVFEDSRGTIWILTNGGISEYDGIEFKNYTEKNGLINNTVVSVIEDREKNLWFATDGGLTKYTGRLFVNFNKGHGLNQNTVWGVHQDGKKGYWFATHRGINYYDGRDITNPLPALTSIVYQVLKGPDGVLWFGTDEGVAKFNGKRLIRYTTRQGMPDNIVLRIASDKKGNIWCATGQGVARFDGHRFNVWRAEDGLKNNTVWSIYHDSRGIIWAGTDAGASYFNGTDFTFVTGALSLPHPSVGSIIEDQRGNILIGTFAGPIIRYDPNAQGGDSVSMLDLGADAYTHDLMSMIFDREGNLWLGTNGGAKRINFHPDGSKTIKHFGKNEGFTGIECNHGAIYQDIEGYIWFGTIKGLNRFDHREEYPNTMEPLTSITGLRVFFEDLPWLNYSDGIDYLTGLPINLRLPHNKNYLSFDFSGISLTAPEKVRYQYKLDGFEDNWTPARATTQATYGYLPSGEYVFQVKACNNDNLWNSEPASFAFEIAPPFWLTWWFLLIGILMIVGGIYAFIHIRTREINNRRIALEEQVRNRTKELLSEQSKKESIIEELAAQKEQLSVTLRSIADCVITCDAAGSIVMVNEAFTELTGRRAEKAQGEPLADVLSLSQDGKTDLSKDLVSRILDSEHPIDLYSTATLSRKDDSTRIVSVSGSAIGDKSGMRGAVLVLRDVTKKQQMEKELQKSQKLESVGVLAGGIAHDFNNLLAVILGNVSLAKLKLKESRPEEVIELITESEHAGKRARDLTQQLLTFSKGGAPVKRITNVEDIIREATLFALRGSNVNCIYDVEPGDYFAEVDEGQINQVVNNIVINAKQAMPEGGTVTIRMFLPIAGNTDMNPALQPHERGYLRVEIADEGTGIATKYLTKIFDPFFTTKQSGSGLGLATSYSIIRNHGGTISVDSSPTAGSCFTVFLPASLAEPFEENPIENIPLPASDRRVLVMDDDDGVRSLMRRMLEGFGYEVETAQDGEEAIKQYQVANAAKHAFDLVILDLTVAGGMGGQETLEKLLKIDPAVMAIVSSGYSDHPVMANYESYGFKGILVKPFQLSTLTFELDRILNGNK